MAPKLDPRILLALGLTAACRPVADVIRPDVDTVEPDTDLPGDTDVPPSVDKPCLSPKPPPAQPIPPTIGPCLEPPPDIGPCLSPKLGPCLGPPPVDLGPCLDPPARDTGLAVCLSEVADPPPPKTGSKGKKGKNSPRDDHLDVCLEFADPDRFEAPPPDDEPELAPSMDEARRRVLDRGVLPDDVAAVVDARRRT